MRILGERKLPIGRNITLYSVKESDMWGTPRALAARMVREFGIALDVCATAETAVCDCYIGIEDRSPRNQGRIIQCDSLETSWSYASGYMPVWMNPPYSNPMPWVRKASEEGKHITVVGLLKADTSTNWWRKYVAECADEVWFLPRLKHMGAPGVANFPQAIVIWRPQSGPYMGHRLRYPELTPEERGLKTSDQLELEAL